MASEFDNIALANLQEYLRIRSVHPNVNYDECISFLKRKAKELDLPVQVFEVVPKKPILVMTWEGLQPELPSILLNSHMDVVPVFEESWTHPPFAAEIVDGEIYGRGVQDMKSVAIIYLETIRRLKSQGIRLKRTVHLTFVPDEEIGGVDGMAKFVHTEHFRNLNVAFGLDEGLPSPNDEYVVYNGERSIWHECISFLKRKAKELDLPVQVFEVVPKKPILVMTWEGLQPELPSILLNSHMDVVPVFEESWTHPPFAAEIVDGEIYGRGVQDMKSVAIIYLETIRRLKSQGVRLKRTVHLTFVPDEEIGGVDGMAKFVHTEHFRNLNVAFGLDEGLPSPNDEYVVYNGERSIWHITITCPGKSGHGSLLLPNTCGEKIRYIIDKFMDMRQESKSALEANPQLTIGDVTSVNLTKLSGGIQDNVVPEKMTATFDIRVALSVDHVELENKIKQWCREAGEGVTYEFSQKNPYIPPTEVDDSNPYWLAVKSALESLQIPVSVHTFPGGTDSRFVREVGVPALCLSPLRRARPALHAHDESLPVAVLFDAVAHYTHILTNVANV